MAKWLFFTAGAIMYPYLKLNVLWSLRIHTNTLTTLSNMDSSFCSKTGCGWSCVSAPECSWLPSSPSIAKGGHHCRNATPSKRQSSARHTTTHATLNPPGKSSYVSQVSKACHDNEYFAKHWAPRTQTTIMITWKQHRLPQVSEDFSQCC